VKERCNDWQPQVKAPDTFWLCRLGSAIAIGAAIAIGLSHSYGAIAMNYPYS